MYVYIYIYIYIYIRVSAREGCAFIIAALIQMYTPIQFLRKLSSSIKYVRSLDNWGKRIYNCSSDTNVYTKIGYTTQILYHKNITNFKICEFLHKYLTGIKYVRSLNNWGKRFYNCSSDANVYNS